MKKLNKLAVVAIAMLVIGILVGTGIGMSMAPTPPTPGTVTTVTSTQTIKKTVVQTVEAGKKLKVGFIYVGPIGDYGWTNAHDVGRKIVESKLPWMSSVYIESVPESDAARFIDKLVQDEKVDIVFTTSFGFMDPTFEAANKYPNIIFFHCSGFKRAPNMGTYFAEFYQLYYLNGLMAGALTKTGKIGYVGAHAIPEVIRHINAFTIGVREVNPQATVKVTWIGEWFSPPKAKAAAEALIAEGIDTLAFTEDSPTVVEVGEAHTKQGQQIYTFSHYSPMLKYGPDSVVSGQLVHWEVLYEEILARVYLGLWNKQNLQDADMWWMLKEKAVEMGSDFGVPINEKFVPELKSKMVNDPLLGKISVYDLVMKRVQQMSEETVLFDPFVGPLKNQEGKVMIATGQRGSHDDLWGMMWFVEGVIGAPVEST